MSQLESEYQQLVSLLGTKIYTSDNLTDYFALALILCFFLGGWGGEVLSLILGPTTSCGFGNKQENFMIL